MNNVLLALLSIMAFFSTGLHAEPRSALLGNEPVKIAVLGMGVYNVVGLGEGMGAASASGSVGEAPKFEKDLFDEFDFKAVSEFALDQYKTKLSGVRKWQVLSARELGNDEAIAKFSRSVKDSAGKIPGSGNADRESWWTAAEGLPFVQTQWIVCHNCGSYQRAIAEAAEQFCAETGVGGVWLQSTYLGFGTKGPGKPLGPMPRGPSQATAMVGVIYVLIDKNGKIIFDSGRIPEQYRSEDSLAMASLTKAYGQEMMKLHLDVIATSAREVAKRFAR